MNKKKVGIIAECTCDLPRSTFEKYGIDVLYFLIETESGIFTDTDEITAQNILMHMESGGKRSKPYPPTAEVYKKAFEKNLSKYDEVILVSISSSVSHSVEQAKKSAALIEDGEGRIHIFDSGHLSSGLGFMVMKAAEMANDGCSAEKILSELELLKARISTTFIIRNTNYLYRNGLIKRWLDRICTIFNIHPILEMKNGKLGPKSFIIGNYSYAYRKYVRKVLKRSYTIDKKQVFIAYAGCSVKMLRTITREIEKQCHFEEVTLVSASATISCNCGPETFGVMFVRNQ